MKYSIRKRFDRLREAMQWSWKDIDEITGRKSARTNIAKRVPAWANLAIQAHEGYEVLLRHHFIELSRLMLGSKWSYSLLSEGVIHFRKAIEQEGDDNWIDVNFWPGRFMLESSTSELYGLAEKLRTLYPNMEGIIRTDEGRYQLQVIIAFDLQPEETIKNLSQQSRQAQNRQ